MEPAPGGSSGASNWVTDVLKSLVQGSGSRVLGGRRARTPVAACLWKGINHDKTEHAS